MRPERQQEVVRDASLTFAAILKNQIPPNLEKKQAVEVVFDVPDVKKVEKARGEGKVLVSVILIDVSRSTLHQTTEQPIVRDEDPETGEIIEYKQGPPTFIMPRYLFTPWTGDALHDQLIMGLIMRIFFSRNEFLPEDIQGKSIHTDASPMIVLVEQFNIEKQMRLWQAMGHPYRPSVVYGVNLRIDSMIRVMVRRVRERILDFKKLEG